MEDLIKRLSEDPEVVDTFSRDELETARAELIEYGKTLMDGLAESDDKKADLEAAKEAKSRLEAVTARLDEFKAEDETIAAEAEEIAVAFTPDEEPEVEEVAEETEEAPEAEVETEEVEAEVETPEAIAASKPSVSAMAKRIPKSKQPEPAPIVAAAAIGLNRPNGFSSPEDIADTALQVWNSWGHTNGVEKRQAIASFDSSPVFEYEKLTGDIDHDGEIFDAMLKDIKRADSPQALTAAASFCAPAEPRYDYFGIAERGGLVQLPTLNARRGRITYRTSPSYASVLANASWSGAAGQVYTAANAESGASKASFDAECPATVTCSVDAYPVDIRFTNFTDRFDPETVANVMENTMIYHDHYMNAQHISTMVTASTARGGGSTGGGGLVNVANLVGFEAAAYRDTYRMSPNALLELVIPFWVVDALVADLVARDSTQSFENARARVRATFASLGLRVQEVQDWQSIGDAGDGGWRQAADMLLFAPGTFVRLDGGTLDLGIVRDSTLNSTNEFSVFAESFEAVCEIGHDSWLLDDVTICPSGATGNRVTLDCNPGFGS